MPIPHPVHIAIAIHNRDSEQPIPLDSEICWDILRAIEDCHGDVQVSSFFLLIFYNFFANSLQVFTNSLNIFANSLQVFLVH